ncbi:hypothetical protein BAE44_0000613 [Dichanthelium oligosanthes]|uniref:Uncharacterized protein n=1 Tax=Dichanthelium oligosanthes TaxID=888268 RepID=A0A1E5WLT7_9POAL|nr:hypothetical protein BAE44_0000613 [Dichanthelium oligosanthes]
MLNHLAQMVANGTTTSSGFKKVHLNMCARTLNEHFRAKTADLDVDPLVGAFTSLSDRLANAIEKLAKGDMDLPPDLYNVLKSLPGFNSVHISFYYSHLVAHPHIGRAFYNLPFDAKIDWVVEFITEKFPEN